MAILPATQERLQLKHLSHPHRSASTADRQDVIQGLSQDRKTLPPKYFYDEYGSQLFEQICQLPEYYPTRTEDSILKQYADKIARMTGACELVELGSGSSTKTRRLLDAYQGLTNCLHYIPIDVSGSILTQSAQQLLQEYSSLQIQGLVGTYEQALVELERTPAPSRMVCFLGSTLGNLNPQECDRFFDHILEALHMGEYFLLGVDLQKPKDILEAAYNDAQGVTAAFNLNMLEHLNERFRGNFKRQNFEHWAFYNQELNQIEMHLRCLNPHTVDLQALDLQVGFVSGETIRTEISRKFNLQEVQAELAEKGLKPVAAWSDSNDWFGLILSQKV
ncbi:L-histidine N(alpha)-methyltransferase [Roseofilum reptotaenium CS-1145]|uniref:L-histidine N(alpha)-methyltransferase n=1 Tax=Roseofilum reptotaenium TaxID=1233427 RepID=UPI000A628D9A|nr:L-histidine N(alpha)-methyltransferase [Roseofilum reptotaenium]MDB9515388.1 L-histidine N(alpha)-methyltransferase [Roseofilum reptotaenium CS-1145]